MAITKRLIPPGTGPSLIIINGRTYLMSGGAQDVPEFDANGLEANGWTAVAPSGTTAQRPTSALPTAGQSGHLHPGTKYFDSTLGVTIVWDGKNWRHENTGAIA